MTYNLSEKREYTKVGLDYKNYWYKMLFWSLLMSKMVQNYMAKSMLITKQKQSSRAVIHILGWN